MTIVKARFCRLGKFFCGPISENRHRELLKDPGMMSHDEFVRGYENGSLGCSVSVWQTLRLFFAGAIPEKTISIKLLPWALGFLLLIASCIIGFFRLPVIWALLGTAAALAFYVSAFFYGVGELVLSVALANKEFYEFAKAKRALIHLKLQRTSSSADKPSSGSPQDPRPLV